MPPNMLTDDFREFLSSLNDQAAEEVINVLKQAAVGQKSSKLHSYRPAQRIRKSRKTSKKMVSTGEPERPVNRWVAFRKYYHGSLSPYTQSQRSSILSKFWDNDLFQEKWEVLALAYNVVRGKSSKEDVPLGEFLNQCASQCGIIPPEKYQEVMGWELVIQSDGTESPRLVRKRIPDYNSLPENHKASGIVDVNGLVAYCKSIGFGCGQAVDSSAAGKTAESTSTFVESPSDLATATSTSGNPEEAPADSYDYAAFDPTMDFGPPFDPGTDYPALNDGGMWNAVGVEMPTNMLVDMNGHYIEPYFW